MKLLRFKVRLFFAAPIMYFYYLKKAKEMVENPENYTDQQMYDQSYKSVNFVRRLFSTKTDFFGLENIPENGNYIMYSNHQGKYDALGIILAHKNPFSILWDIHSANHLLVRQISQLLKCEIIDNSQKQNFIPCMQRIADRVKEGRPFLIFPEGGYTDNKNTLQDFHTGCFMTSILSESTVLPVVVYDSYKAIEGNKIFGRAKTQVHFLKPIPYEEYKHLNRKNLSQLVKDKIQEKLTEIESVAN